MKMCSICGETKELDKFQSNGFQPNGKKKYKPNCSSCTNAARYKDRMEKISKALDQLGMRLQCELCGYKKNSAALHFHHIDPKEKEFRVSEVRSSTSYERLYNEIEKCVVLCANCHAEEHNPQCEIVVDDC